MIGHIPPVPRVRRTLPWYRAPRSVSKEAPLGYHKLPPPEKADRPQRYQTRSLRGSNPPLLKHTSQHVPCLQLQSTALRTPRLRCAAFAWAPIPPEGVLGLKTWADGFNRIPLERIFLRLRRPISVLDAPNEIPSCSSGVTGRCLPRQEGCSGSRRASHVGNAS